MTKEIPLTKGKTALIDDEDFEYISQFRWYCSHNRACRAPRGGWRAHNRRRAVFMHREIMHTPDGMETDHINGNPLDNRRCNLRICTNAQNHANTGKPVHNTSGFKGVTWSKKDKKWVAQIRINNRHIHIGEFRIAEDAARAYDRVARELHGEFARTNFDEQIS